MKFLLRQTRQKYLYLYNKYCRILDIGKIAQNQSDYRLDICETLVKCWTWNPGPQEVLSVAYQVYSRSLVPQCSTFLWQCISKVIISAQCCTWVIHGRSMKDNRPLPVQLHDNRDPQCHEIFMSVSKKTSNAAVTLQSSTVSLLWSMSDP